MGMSEREKDENYKIDEAIDYAKHMLKGIDPDKMVNYQEVRNKILEMIGFLTIIKK